jgi:hypothetical protein
MCCHGVVGNQTAVLTEMQIHFADFEENLNATNIEFSRLIGDYLPAKF